MVGTSNQSVPEMAIDPLFLGIFHGINQVPGDPPGNSTVHPGQGPARETSQRAARCTTRRGNLGSPRGIEIRGPGFG